MSSLWMDLILRAACVCVRERECEDDERRTGIHNR